MLHKLLYEWILLLLFIYITGHSPFCCVSNYCERTSELKHSISFIDFPLQPLVSYDQEHSSRLFSTPTPHLNSMVKHYKAFDSYYCCVTVTLFWQIQRGLGSQLLPNLIFSFLFFLKFDFGFEAGAQLGSWRESACQGESLLLGKKNSPGITPHLQRRGSGTRQGKMGRGNSEKHILI